MIIVYTSPSCSSCSKVVKWLGDQKIPFVEKNIFKVTLNKKELSEMLAKTENGTADIISTRSRLIKEKNIDFDDFKISELIEFIKQNPSVLKRPIIVDDKRIQVGYNEEEIRSFIPRAKRYVRESRCTNDCENYEFCDHRKNKEQTQ